MLKSLIYKEWIKTRWILLGIVLVLAGFAAYDFLALAKNAQLRGYEFLWTFTVMKDSVLVENLRFLPAAAGILLAVCQFVPETIRKRLKLTLHLPYPQTGIVSLMQGYGLVCLVLIFSVQAVAIGFFLKKYLVYDLVIRIIFSILTWYCAGLMSYVWTSAACLEPSWKTRILEFVIMGVLLSIFFMSQEAMAYKGSLLILFLVSTVLALMLIHYSVRRFKDGVQ